MSCKYPRNELENRLVFSRWRNVDNGSADVTSEGKLFQIGVATTAKARLATIMTAWRAALRVCSQSAKFTGVEWVHTQLHRQTPITCAPILFWDFGDI